ncbi:hypothetical protein ID866_3622 [Astraeus odoratus]|nr:hypothetical protein ID866_3622 [Astraeus odoratus]
MATYDSLHRQCRTLESLFDSKLTAYSRLASAIAKNSDDVEAAGSRERWQDVEGEVEDLLEKANIQYAFYPKRSWSEDTRRSLHLICLRTYSQIDRQAYETRSEFARQRTSLSSINTRMTNVIGTIPGINNLLSMIKSRRRRDSIILGVVIAVCMISLLSYMTR